MPDPQGTASTPDGSTRNAEAELASLKQQRSNMKRNISNMKTKVERDGAQIDPTILECRLQIVESYFKQMMYIQNEIEKISPSDNARGDLEEVYVTTKAKILSFMTHRSPQHEISLLNGSSSGMQAPHSRLPTLKLPRFDGKYAEYKRFYASFAHLVHNESSLSAVDKFNYLLNCLSGPALAVVESFQVTAENYPLALQRLKERYDNSVLIFQEHIVQLFNISAITKPNAQELRKLIDTVAALRSSLLTLGNESDVMNSLIVHIVLSKLDSESKTHDNEKQEYASLPSWDDCYKTLERRCQHLEVNSPATTSQNSTGKGEAPKQTTKRNNKTFLTTNELCHFCNSVEHVIRNCQEFNAIEISQRIAHAKTAGLCLNCLRKGHIAAKCSSSARCRNCKQLHHTLLHRTSSVTTTGPTSTTVSQSASEPPQNERPLQSFLLHSHKCALLPTAIVLVKDKFGQWQPVRALLDSCSEVNLISEEVAKMLQLERRTITQQVAGISNTTTRIKHIVSATIKSRITEFNWSATFSVIKSISSTQPNEYIDKSAWNIPDGIQLADPTFFKPTKIDMLISAEIFFDLLLYGKISLGSQMPTLFNTVFGWVVGGKFESPAHTDILHCNMLQESQSLNSIVQRFWEIENYEISKQAFTNEERECEQYFLKTVSTTPEGRIKMKLPFKQDPDKLGDSQKTAIRRFLAVERRLEKNQELKQKYIQFMDDYLKLGHMSRIENVDRSSPHFYIPHHCVLRPTSTSTKLRVVFDGSAKTSSNVSLNDLLMVGPTIQEDLITILFSFRLNPFALTADIVKMYRQFLIDEGDRKFQQILWRKNSNEPMGTYRLNTVTYGLSAAPFLAIRSLHYIANQHKGEFPSGAQVLTNDMYVDDVLTGADTVEELNLKRNETTSILSRAGLQLAKFNSNTNQVVDHSSDKFDIKTNEMDVARALGMVWSPKADTFSFQIDVSRPIEFTKRSVLSQTARIFDLLGLLSPVTIKCKILIQEMWLRNLGWDDQLPEDLQNTWRLIYEDLPIINNIEVPRYTLTVIGGNTQLHGFSDASERAYGCCLYTRTVVDGNVKTALLVAKAKVAPIKAQSLPRLELCGALMLTRIWKKIQPRIESRLATVHFWTDSKIVLQWIEMHSCQLNCFVANRVSELQDKSEGVTWRHVPTKNNPADIVSRGCSAKDMPHTMWASGPEFFKLSEADWPSQSKSTSAPIDVRRRAVYVNSIDDNFLNKIINNYSSYCKIVRIFSFLFRCINKIPPIHGLQAHQIVPVNAAELANTFWQIISLIQNSEYKSEIERLQSSKSVSPNLQKMSPFLHGTKLHNKTVCVLRVGGRLENAEIPFDAKYPAIVPRNNRFILLYVEYLHRAHLHAGQKVLIALVREKLWVINLRYLVRKVVRSCINCFHYKPRLMTQIMGNLPANRLRAERPFMISGVDFCGPFYTSYKIRGKQPYKTYVAVFICFASKAIHIEPVTELSTNAFLLCLKRFVSRRGIPKRIFCDNATNFVGAQAKLAEFRRIFLNSEIIDSINTHCASIGIEFCFIPPRAPHFGGLWEAAVKSAKTLLVKNIAHANLTFEELFTLLTEVEAMLNSRPLCTSEDANDGEPLTPAHLLIGSSLLAPPDDIIGVSDQTKLAYLTRWQRVTFLKNQFWQIWRRDYLHQLQARAKWSSAQTNIEVGQLVLVHEDNTPPQHWPMAKISSAIPGTDGKVRVVDLHTAKGSFRRPICKIAPLPITDV